MILIQVLMCAKFQTTTIKPKKKRVNKTSLIGIESLKNVDLRIPGTFQSEQLGSILNQYHLHFFLAFITKVEKSASIEVAKSIDA